MSSVMKNDLNYGMTDRVLELTRKLAVSSVLTREELLHKRGGLSV